MPPDLTRRGALLAAGLGTIAAASTPARAAPAATVLIEQTYLKAIPGKRADLIAFITANWFAMDRIGVERGLFTSYRLFADIDDNPDWDLVMVVGYPQPEGYEQPATKAAFDAIRAAHRQVLIDRQGLGDLGRIVRHHRLKSV